MGTTYAVTTTRHHGALGALVFALFLYVLTGLGAWGTYKKAGANGEPAWSAFIPIYQWIVLLRIAGRPKTWGWFILLALPSLIFPAIGIVFSLAFLVVYIIVLNDLSKSFGHGGGFTVGLVLLSIIFWFILWLGQSRYLGPAGPAGRGGYGGGGGFPPPGSSGNGYGGGYTPEPGYPPIGQPSSTPPPSYPPAYPPPGQAPPGQIPLPPPMPPPPPAPPE